VARGRRLLEDDAVADLDLGARRDRLDLATDIRARVSVIRAVATLVVQLAEHPPR